MPLRPYHIVISTGPVASSRASTGHGGRSASGVVVVVTIVGGAVDGAVCPGTVLAGGPAIVVAGVGGGGAGSLPALRIDSPEPHAASSTHATSANRTSLIPSPLPRSSPRTNWRWKISSTMKMGTAAMTVPAMTRLGSSRRASLICLSPTGKVFMSDSVVMRTGHRYWNHEDRNVNRASAPIVGRTSGTATCRRNPRCPTPSIAAASRRSRGRLKKTWRMRNVPNAVARNGTARPWYVLSHPNVSMVRRLTTTVASNGTSRVARNDEEQQRAARELEDREGVAREHRREDHGHRHDNRDDERVDHVAPEVPVAPGLAQHVEREGIGDQRVLEDLVARLQRRDHGRVHGEQHDHGHHHEQPVPADGPPPRRGVVHRGGVTGHGPSPHA